MARISRWFLDITLDSETLRWWSGTGDITFESNTYTGLGDRWTPPDSLKRKSSLKSEKIDLEFDSSRQSDNSDPIGALLDEKWRNRAVRLRRLAWDAGDGPDDGDVLEDERGRIRNLSDTLQADSPAIVSMEIESGALAYLERRMETRSPASQTRVFAGDKGFDLIAKLEGKTLAWRTKHKKAGTVQYELDEEYEPDPREWVLGRFAKTGSFVAAWTHQEQNKSLTRIYAIADHRISKLDKVWINGDLLIDDALSHGVRTEITALRSGGPRAWITFYDGRPDQTADSFLQSVEPTWTSAHRLRGVAYVIIDHRWDSDLANSYDYRFGGEGARLYDRRLDTTAGGSGSQRWDDPSTWTYSTNAMVAADHYRSGIRIMSGSTAMWFGIGEAIDAVPYAEFEALADHCDENVTLKAGGTQKRYEVNGVLSASDDHAKNLEKIARQMAARAIDQGGRIAFRPPIERTPVITLTDGDLKRGTESVADPGGLIDDMVNTLSGRFINPANDYKKDDYPEVSISSYVDDDNGEISDTLDLDLEISGERSQRIAKLKIEDSRRIFQMTETYTVKARVIEPGEWFVRESVIRGFPSGKTFVADEVTRFLDGSIEVVATEIDPDQLVWDEETAVDLSEPPSFPQLTLQDLEVAIAEASPRSIGVSGVSLPGVDITIAYSDDPLPYETDVEVTRDNGSGEPAAGAEVLRRAIPAGQTLLTLSGELDRDTGYVFRVRSRFDGRVGAWSDWVAFTTPDTYAVPASEAAPGGALNAVLQDHDQAIADAQTAADDADTKAQTALDDAGQALDEAAANAASLVLVSNATAASVSNPSRKGWTTSISGLADAADDIAASSWTGSAVQLTEVNGNTGPKTLVRHQPGMILEVEAVVEIVNTGDGACNPVLSLYGIKEDGTNGSTPLAARYTGAEVTSPGEVTLKQTFRTDTAPAVAGATNINQSDSVQYRVMAGSRNGGASNQFIVKSLSWRDITQAVQAQISAAAAQTTANTAISNYDALNLTITDPTTGLAARALQADLLTLGGAVDDQGNLLSVAVDDITAIEADLTDKQNQIDAKAAITYVDSAIAGVNGSIATTQTNLTAAFESADDALQDSIDSLSDTVATKASLAQLSDAQASNESARTTLLTNARAEWQEDIEDEAATITAEYEAYVATEVGPLGGRVTALETFETETETTLTNYNTLIQGNADDISAQQVALTNVKAAFQRSNVMPVEYWRGKEGETSQYFIFQNRAIIGSTGVENPLTGDDTIKIVHQTSDDTVNYFGLTPDGQPNLKLRPAKWGFILAGRWSSALWSTIGVNLRDASRSIIASDSFTNLGGDQEYRGVLDLSGLSDVQDVFIETVNISARGDGLADVGDDHYFHGFQLSLLDANSDEVGQWDETGLGGTVAEHTSLIQANADGVSALGIQYDSLDATVGDISSTVTTQGTALADITGRVEATWGVLLDGNGVIVGVKAHTDGTTGDWTFQSDTFKIKTASGTQTPFSVSGDTVEMTNVEVDTFKANSVGAGALSVTQLSAITGTIGLLRTATSGERVEIEDNQIRGYDSSGTLRFRLGVLP